MINNGKENKFLQTVDPECPECGKRGALFTWSILKPYKRIRKCRHCGAEMKLTLKQWFAQVVEELTTWV